jgi:hypothetical protein
VRTYLVQLPLALLLAVVAIQIVILSLSATDAMSDAIAGGTGADVATLISTVTKGLVAAAADPSIASFVLLLIALLIAVAAFVLWLELLIRAAAVYVAVLFLPLAMATLVWPAVSHWARRLVETLAALILSKFVIVATLSLAAGAVASGASGAPNSGGFSAVLAGGALLVMATFVPFAILRLIPAIEAGAVGHLDGLRQRGTSTMTAPLRTAANHALHAGLTAAGDASHMAQAAAGKLGGAGSGTTPESLEELQKKVNADNGGQVPDADGNGIGDANSPRILEEATARGVQSPPKGPKPIVGWTEGDDGSAGAGAGSGAGVGAGLGAAPVPGPDDPADAWKWEGVPPGHHLMGRVDPGWPRFSFGPDANGKKYLQGLPRAWPPGEAPGEAAGEEERGR